MEKVEENYAVNIENATILINNNEILHNISLKIKEGEKYFILGANGAGKTTLVKLILGYLWAKYDAKSEAKVEVLGNKFGRCDINKVRKQIAWVSPFIQKYLQQGSSGVDTILSGKEGFLGFFRHASEEELEEVKKLLTSLDALHLANKKILEMSSGEQMKILIARALFTKPKLMILDEPNVFLDIKEREKFLNIIEKIATENPNLTIIFISQRIEDILPVFNKGLILKDGKIDTTGTRKEILTEENLKNVFGVNIKLIETKDSRLWCVVEK